MYWRRQGAKPLCHIQFSTQIYHSSPFNYITVRVNLLPADVLTYTKYDYKK